jgi:KaiC/GvpD/RAD55 family RecA-like ATPase
MTGETFTPENAWFTSVAPDGIPTNTSTVISGPGGSGKPLIGFAVLDAWLDAGGHSVLLLTNSGAEFVYDTMELLYDTERSVIDEQVEFVDFDPTMDPGVDAIEVSKDLIRGNLLDPAVWRATIDQAIDRTDDDGPGTLLFGSALNLFLFSDTYRDPILDAFEQTVEREDLTSLFTVSSSAYAAEIGRVEDAADTVLLTDMDDGQLRLRGERSESVPLETDFSPVPFTSEQLDRIRSVAEASRDELLPTIKAI